MPRTGLLIGLAALLIAAAVGMLVWTNFLGHGKNSPANGPASIPGAPSDTSREAQLVDEMVKAAATDGYSATFSEADVGKWALADGTKIERFGLNGAGTVFARLSNSHALDKQSVAWPALGLSATLPVEFANLSAGRRVEIGIIARTAQSNGSSELSAVYASRQAGNSGWQAIALTSDFALYKFTYDVNTVEGGYTNGPMLILSADAAGQGKAVELLGMYVKALPK